MKRIATLRYLAADWLLLKQLSDSDAVSVLRERVQSVRGEIFFDSL